MQAAASGVMRSLHRLSDDDANTRSSAASIFHARDWRAFVQQFFDALGIALVRGHHNLLRQRHAHRRLAPRAVQSATGAKRSALPDEGFSVVFEVVHRAADSDLEVGIILHVLTAEPAAKRYPHEHRISRWCGIADDDRKKLAI